MKFVGYVIHLRRAVGRRPVAERLCAMAGVPCEILDAVDGGALPAQETDQAYQPRLIAPHYPFPLSGGEIGCFLSHRRAWTEFLKGEAEACVILEDDMEIMSPFAQALALAGRHIQDLGYIQFQTRAISGATSGTALDQEGPAVLFQPRLTGLRTSGQVISRDAARRLLDLTATFDRPVDTFLQMHWHTGLRLGAIVPSGLVDVALGAGGSTISSKRSIADKLKREVQRTRYRRQIARLSNQEVPL